MARPFVGLTKSNKKKNKKAKWKSVEAGLGVQTRIMKALFQSGGPIVAQEGNSIPSSKNNNSSPLVLGVNSKFFGVVMF